MTDRESTGRERAEPEELPPSALERVVFFSDAVFAIVITLLVLPLTAEIDLPAEGTDTARQVWDMWPRVVSFATSFLVIGQFWLAHHRMFAQLRKVDHGLIWLNLVFLLTVSFLPFPTAVLGDTPTADDSFPVVFYAASLTVTSFALTIAWLYAARMKLLDRTRTPHQIRAYSLRTLMTSVVFLLSVGAAFLGLWVAVLFWLVLLPAIRVSLGRLQASRERAMGGPAGSESQQGTGLPEPNGIVRHREHQNGQLDAHP
jgi:TMEM175 potassium channel family protein